jgi:hypothetical protein
MSKNQILALDVGGGEVTGAVATLLIDAPAQLRFRAPYLAVRKANSYRESTGSSMWFRDLVIERASNDP